MRNRKLALLAAAAMAAVPVAANAVVISYTIDPNDFTVSLNGYGGTYLSLSAAGGVLAGTPTAETLTLPAGAYVKFGVDATMTATTSGTATASVPAATIGQAVFGINDSAGSVASVYATAASNASGTSVPTSAPAGGVFSISAKGKADGVGGISATFGVTSGQSGGGPASFTAGNGSATEIARLIGIGMTGTAGQSATFTLLPYFAGTQYITGTSNSYAFNFLGTNDSVSGATLKLIVAGVATTTTSPSTHPIISLTAGATPASGYGSVDGVITLVKAGGGYTPTTAVGFATSNNASVSIVNFSGTDTEVYALQLAQGGTLISPNASVLTNIVADINGTNGLTNASTGVTASVIAPGSTYAKLFPGYDVLITSTSGLSGPSDELGFDFTALGEQNPADAAITVTAVSAVPEPATAAGIVLGATGLLLGRRKNRAVPV